MPDCVLGRDRWLLVAETEVPAEWEGEPEVRERPKVDPVGNGAEEVTRMMGD